MTKVQIVQRCVPKFLLYEPLPKTCKRCIKLIGMKIYTNSLEFFFLLFSKVKYLNDVDLTRMTQGKRKIPNPNPQIHLVSEKISATHVAPRALSRSWPHVGTAEAGPTGCQLSTRYMVKAPPPLQN